MFSIKKHRHINGSTLRFIAAAIVIMASLLASCYISKPENSQTGNPPELDYPYYFIAIHNEPYNQQNGSDLIERNYLILTQMVERANSYNIKLTLMFTAQWADYIAESPTRLSDLRTWAEQGHEIAAHHHSIYHGNWDGYTDYLPKEALAQRNKQGKKGEKYFGTLEDFITSLEQINPDINSGCLNDENDKRALPDDIIYDTCSGFANYGQPGRQLGDGASQEKGKNEYVTVGTYNGIERKWLTHFQITTAQRQQQAQALFNSMDSGVYGAVTHSIPNQAPPYYAFLEFLHEKDPSAAGSRTLTEVIEQKLLPECRIADELLN